MERFYTVDIDGYKEDLPILPLPNGISICFFNLHGNVELTEHCGKELAKLLGGCDVVLTAESKGLQLSHVIARELGQNITRCAARARNFICKTASRQPCNP